MSDPQSIFASLMAVIEDRKANPPKKSYTTSLLTGGVEKIGAKITEEAAEVVDAAADFCDALVRCIVLDACSDFLDQLDRIGVVVRQ